MRVFLDTNVLVSAFSARGLSADLFRFLADEHEVVLGEVVLEEFSRVLVNKLRAPALWVDDLVGTLRTQFTVVPKPSAVSSFEIRDPDDWWILGSAIAARVDLLVTGDGDLLSFEGPLPLRILSPREAWEFLRANP